MRKLTGCLLALFIISCHTTSPVLWHVHLQSRSYADPVVDRDRVFLVSGAGEVFCISLSTGSFLWKAMTDSPVVASPAFSDRALFVGTQDGSLFSFDRRSGSLIWRRRFPHGEGFEAPLSVFAQRVLAPSTSGNLYALSQSNGETAWVHTGTGKYSAGAVISGSHIFIGEWGGDFFCLGEGGQEEWRFKAAARIVDTACVTRNIVCFPTHGRYLYALDAPSGRLLWRFETQYPTSAVLTENSVTVGSTSRIFSLRLQDGHLLQKIEMGKTILNIGSSPTGGVLVVTDQPYKLDLLTRKFTLINGLPADQKPFKIAETGFCYIITDDLYSVFCIRK